MRHNVLFQVMLKSISMGSLAVVFSIMPLRANGADVTGHAQVIDGDTIRIDATEIGLFGIDAPELKQTCKTHKGHVQLCGELARQMLAEYVKGRKLTCEGRGADADGKMLAVCYVGLINMNEQMVADGWALAIRPEGNEFIRAEKFAKARNEGMWRSEFIPPWEWRRLN